MARILTSVVGLLLPSMPFPGAALVTSRSTRRHRSVQQLRQYSFSEFVKDYDRSYMPGTEEWSRRERLFNASRQEIVDFQSGSARSWEKAATKFMDYSPEEFKFLLGYRGRGSRGSPIPGSVELYSRRNQVEVNLPVNVALGKKPGSLIGIVRDQGDCGSCWAEAATAVLEGAMEQNATLVSALMPGLKGKQKFVTLSSQTMVSCTPNPRNCGGKGGCEGATAELGFEMVQKRGMPLAVEWTYQSGGGGGTSACKDSVFTNNRVGISGYSVLPSNKLVPLKQALFETGSPIVISVDATGWAFYGGGIYSDVGEGKKGEFTVNHAVVLTGYQDKTSEEQAYWLVKNSWGQFWGETGFIRVEMKDKEEEHCGWDHNTHDGLACDGDPDTAWVCGTCGILYDSSYPTGLYLMEAEQQTA